LTRSAQFEILLGNNKAVTCLRHDAQPFLGDNGFLIAGQKYAETLLGATSDTSAQLMKLRQSESLGMFDHHHRRIRNVNADLDHCRRDEDLDVTGDKRAHHLLFFSSLHLAMQQAYRELRENR